MKRILSWIKRFFARSIKPLEKTVEKERAQSVDFRSQLPKEREIFKPVPRGRPRPKPRRAVHQDIGRFMKHGRQAPWYRRSVKAKVKVEEEED